MEQDSYADRREPPLHSGLLLQKSHGLSSSQPCQPKFWKLFFSPSPTSPSSLQPLSAGVKVTGVKAVAGTASHVSRAHSQWLLHARFSSWVQSSGGRLVLRRTPPCPFSRAWMWKWGWFREQCRSAASPGSATTQIWEAIQLAVCSPHCLAVWADFLPCALNDCGSLFEQKEIWAIQGAFGSLKLVSLAFTWT